MAESYNYVIVFYMKPIFCLKYPIFPRNPFQFKINSKQIMLKFWSILLNYYSNNLKLKNYIMNSTDQNHKKLQH